MDLLLSSLARHILDLLPGAGPYVISIDGPGASGKSTFSEILAGQLPGSIVIHFDDFYLPRTDPAVPASHFDYQRLIDQVFIPLEKGLPPRYQLYEWQTDSLEQWQELEACGYIILEGVSSSRLELRPWLDFSIYIDAPYDLRLSRGLERDGDAARDTWVQDWMPREERYIHSPHDPRAYAHLVLDGTRVTDSPDPLLSVLSSRLS